MKNAESTKKVRGQKRKPFVKGGCAEDRAIQSMGGKARKAAHDRAKTIREWAIAFRDAPTKGDPNLTMGGAVALRMYQAALDGDVRAADFLAKIQGEMVERIETAEVPKLVDDI